MKKTLLLITLYLYTLSVSAQCWKFVSASKEVGFASYTLAIASNGTLWGFGSNEHGQLGDGTTTIRTLPVQIGTDNDWVYLATASRNSFAIKSDGTLWSWGNNSAYALGDGTNISQSVPKQVGTETNWKTVSCERDAVVALKTDGTVWRWGSDGYANGSPYGMYPALTIPVPTQLGTDTDWISIERGNTFTMALKSNGSRWGYGALLSGVAGNGNIETGSSNLIQLDAGPWESISIGAHALGIKPDGSLWGWGDNSGGQVGNGTTSYSVNIPFLIDNIHSWKTASTGYNIISESGISIAIRDDNTLWSWGGKRSNNSVYTLGQGNSTPTTVPKQVGNGTDWNFVSGGGYHTAGIQQDNTLWTWGYSDSGQLGNGVSTSDTYELSPYKVECQTPLPVTLASFGVVKSETAIKLTWITTSELNADLFVIQRSADAKHWQAIGQIKAEGFKAGHREYKFVDAFPFSGTNYYRLKMIDLDQTFGYSRVQSANMRVVSALIYPNPVSDNVLIESAGLIEKIELINVQGQILAKYASNPIGGINVRSLPAGLYVIKITEMNGNIQRHKILLER